MDNFTELWRIIPKVAKKVLLDQLKQLENDELIIREEKSGFPPEVSYRVSEKGRALWTENVVIVPSQGLKTARGHRFCAFGQNFVWV
jgi:DNA-binding PadR family transcriptional regulator